MDWGIWSQLGIAAGCLISLFISLNRGWLWTGGQVRIVLEQMQKRIDDRDAALVEQKRANLALDERNDVLAANVGQLVEIGRTSNAALTSLPHVRTDTR